MTAEGICEQVQLLLKVAAAVIVKLRRKSCLDLNSCQLRAQAKPTGRRRRATKCSMFHFHEELRDAWTLRVTESVFMRAKYPVASLGSRSAPTSNTSERYAMLGMGPWRDPLSGHRRVLESVVVMD